MGDCMKFCCDKPYPPIQVEGENTKYAKILLEDYAGEGGEDTAIHRYLYQSFIQEDVKDTLKGIACVEMKHLDMLGKLIWKLGYLPAFHTIDSNVECIIPWTSKYVDYSTDLSKILLDDISKEMQAITRYQKHISEIDDCYIKRVLERIIEDEEVHINCLQILYHKYFGKCCE